MAGVASSRLRGGAGAVLIAVAALMLVPPDIVAGRFSTLEVAAILFSVALIFAGWQSRAGLLGRRPWLAPVSLVLLLALMAASAVWSASGWVSLRDVLAYVLLAATAVVVVHSMRLSWILMGISAAGVFVLVWAVVLAIVDPGSALNPSGALIGPYSNRNTLAYVLLTSAPAAMAVQLRSGRLGVAIKLIVVTLLGTGIIATTSRTALLVFGLLAAVATVLSIGRRSRIGGYLVLAALAAAVIVVLVNFGQVLDYFGKGADINGRVPIWNTVWGLVVEAPLTGYGWSMSWPLGAEPSNSVAAALGGVVVFHAHNELLNWLVTTGVVGGVLIVAIYATLLAASISMLRRGSHLAGVWTLLGAIAWLLRGISDISETHPLGWFVLVIMLGAASQGVAHYRAGRLLSISVLNAHPERSPTVLPKHIVNG